MWLFRSFGLGVGFQRVSSSVDCFVISYNVAIRRVITISHAPHDLHTTIYPRKAADGITNAH